MSFFSKTYPSFLTVKEGSTSLTKPLFPQGREENRPTVLIFLPLRLSCKESSTFSPSPSSSGSGDVTALRCSEPLRSKVGGPSKVFARLCGMGPPSYYLAKGAGYYPYFKTTLACNKSQRERNVFNV